MLKDNTTIALAELITVANAKYPKDLPILNSSMTNLFAIPVEPPFTKVLTEVIPEALNTSPMVKDAEC